MEFEVWAVRVVDGALYPGAKTAARYDVPAIGVIPPGPVDSLTIEVAHAGELIDLAEMIIEYATEGELVPVGDTLWIYNAITSAGDTIVVHTERSAEGREGLQLYAVGWSDGERAYCSVDPCFGLPPFPEDVGALPEMPEVRSRVASVM